MALIYNGQHQSSGAMMYEMYAEETAGSGNNRTILITLKIKPGPYDTTNFSYPLTWKAYVNGSWSSAMNCKGSETWTGAQGWRTFTYTVTTNVGQAASKAISVGFQTITGSGSSWWNLTKSDKTFTVSTTNVPPVMSGAVTADGTTGNKTISEKQGSIVLSWTKASDTNLSGHRIRVSINGGGYVELARVGATTTAYTHDVSSYGEGTTFSYILDAFDSLNSWSNNIYSGTISKNSFIMDTLASSGAIAFSSELLALTYSGGSNSQSGVTISRVLSCNGITVYNSNITASPISLKIWRVGETIPTTPYIKFDDIKVLVATDALKGKSTLTFTLTGTNSNGTLKTSSKTISVDLQTVPNNVTGAQISLVQSESTNYLSIASSSNKYFIPDGVKVTRVKWNAVVGKLGESCTYELYVAYGGGGYSKIADLTTGTLYYNHIVPTQTISQQFKYLVRAKSTYNTSLYSEMPTPAQTLQYYSQPSLVQGTITRGAETAEVVVTVKSNSSIPNINTVGTWQVFASGTTTPIISSGPLTSSQLAQVIQVKNLTDAGTYDLRVTYNDNTGYMSTSKLVTIGISANLPIFFINKYGVGVGGVQASSGIALNVKGETVTTGGLKFATANKGIVAPNGQVILRADNGGATVLSADRVGTIYLRPQGNAVATNQASLNSSGVLNAVNVQVSGSNVYHTGRKPSAADVGALAANAKAVSAVVADTVTNCGLTNTAQDTLDGSFYGTLPNGLKIWSGWYTVVKNSSRVITFPTNYFTTHVAGPQITPWVPNNDYANYSIQNTLSVTAYSKTGLTLVNYDGSKNARVFVLVIGK